MNTEITAIAHELANEAFAILPIHERRDNFKSLLLKLAKAIKEDCNSEINKVLGRKTEDDSRIRKEEPKWKGLPIPEAIDSVKNEGYRIGQEEMRARLVIKSLSAPDESPLSAIDIENTEIIKRIK